MKLESFISLKRILSNIAVIVTGIVFLGAGISKTIRIDETIAAFLFLHFPKSTTTVAAVLLATFELYLAYGLIFSDKYRHIFIRVAIGSLLVFSVYLGYLALLAQPPSCGCGGLFLTFESAKANATFGLVRNLLLGGLLCWAASQKPEIFVRAKEEI